MTGTVAVNVQSIRPEEAYLISGVLRNAYERGSIVEIDTENIKTLADSAPRFTTPVDQMDRLLTWIARKGEHLGDHISINAAHDYSVVYAKTPEELSYLLQSLVGVGYLENPGQGNYRPTVKGWERLAELSIPSIDSDQAFVAMWFDPSLDEAWLKGFKKAIEDAGYSPFRIDRKEHNEKIDDLIVAEIRNSGLVVADFTGHRGGVYFEAGFALGLGLPVIWTCREDHFKKAQFDTRQYNHIRWTDPEDLRVKLLNRIRATVPRKSS